MFWYPFRDIGGVKNANLEAAVNLEVNGSQAKVGFCTTAAHAAATAMLKAGEKVILQEQVAIGPGKPFVKQVALPAGVKEEDLRAALVIGKRELVAYRPARVEKAPLPKPVVPPPAPEEIKTNEELYLAGLRIDQFHNPALEPEPYWEEALKRDPGDSRVNTALGIVALRRGKYVEAEQRLRKALERLTASYTTPKDGEAFYYLGVALKAQGKHDAAFEEFYKAIWSAAWQGQGYYSLAEIASLRGDMRGALELADRALNANALNTRALNLKAAVLRRLGRSTEAVRVAGAALKIDPLEVRSLAERWLGGKDPAVEKQLVAALKDHPDAGLEAAVECGNAGLWEDGTAVLTKMTGEKASPLVYYYLGYFAEKMGRAEQAKQYWRLAAQASPEYVFPFQHEAVAVLERAMAANPSDARAPYYLGNLLYDWQPEEAVKLWERSRAIDGSFAIVHRNLAAAYARQDQGLDKAVASLEKAVSLGGRYAIHFFELDQLYEAAGAAPGKRLAMLEKYHPTVVQRDDATAREIALKVNMGKYDEALELMRGRRFNVWEGGARFNVHDCWTDAHLLRGHARMKAGRLKEALADYQAALEFPENLQVARFRRGGRAPEGSYWVGVAYDALGESAKAREAWKEAAVELPRVGEDDVLPTTDRTVLLYYQAMALAKLGQTEQAAGLFGRLVKSGQSALAQGQKIDFFAKFGEQQTQRARIAQAHYIAGLGHLGLNQKAQAREAFSKALETGPDHLGAKGALGGME
jgi:tetratricopeptide (TPR) repeat protein